MHSVQSTNLFRWAAGLFFLTVFGACQENQPTAITPGPIVSTTATQYRLKKTVRSSSTSTITHTYVYNRAGQLAGYTIRAGAAESAPGQATVFNYDQQGRLTSAERMPTPSFTTARLSYTYDDNGNLSLIAVNEDLNKDGQFKLTQTITLQYGADKLPVKTTVTSGSRTETTRYTYDRGNAVKTEQIINAGSDQTPIVQYRHDDKPNPMVGLPIGTPNAEMFNKNNIIYEGSEMTYSNGLLTLVRTNVKEAPEVQSYIKYEYEAY